MLSLSFATTDHALIARVRAVLAGIAVLLTILAAVQLVVGASYRSRMAEASQQAAALEASEESVRPALQEREQLVRNLSEMASLVEARQFGWTRLLSAVEDAFPSGAALNRLEFDPRERSVSLEGTALSPEALSSLMIGLQKTNMLKNPLLKRQSMEKGTLSFHVTVNYQ